MAIIATLVTPNPDEFDTYRRTLDQIHKRILPDPQQDPAQIDIHEREGILTAVFGCADNVLRKERAILSGAAVLDSGEAPWWRVGGSTPDGSFVLFRSDDSAIEVVTDYAGSRTLWRGGLCCGGVVVSTCLEVVVALLGDFELDEKSAGWFLSSGNSGPRRSLDRRITPLQANTRLRIRRCGTRVESSEYPARQFDPVPETIDEDGIRHRLRTYFDRLPLQESKWILALSGGYDSRAILDGIRDVANVVCVTWSDREKQHAPDGDTEIAARLAKAADRSHVVKFIDRPKSAADLELSARRFIRYCDGRADNLLMYIDNMQVWEEICSIPGGGILRGDELFGTSHAVNPGQITRNMGGTSFRDFEGSPVQRDLLRRFGHRLPPGLARRDGESVSRWRWRLRANLETPTIYAALASVRARFLETASPLLSGSLVNTAEAMSDTDLDGKHLYKQVVSRLFPDVPAAASRSILSRGELFALPATRELFADHLHSRDTREMLGGKATDAAIRAVAGMPASGLAIGRPNVRQLISRATPKWIARARRGLAGRPELDLQELALRSLLVVLFVEEMRLTARYGARARANVRHAIA